MTDASASERIVISGGPKGADLIRAVGFWKIVAEDFRINEGHLAWAGFQAMFVYRFGTWTDLIRFRPLQRFMRLLYRLGHIWVRNLYGIELERTVKVGRRLRLAHQHGIVIHVFAEIGDDVLIRHNVTFGAGAFWTDEGGPKIGSRVSFGPGTVVAGNVQIGDDVSIGPNCTITTDIPANRSVFVPPPRVLPKAPPAAPSEAAGAQRAAASPSEIVQLGST
jgi:serine O-acetyltransferase